MFSAKVFPKGITLLLLLTLVFAGSVSAAGPVSPSDPTLRLWLKADTLTRPDPADNNVPQWNDSSGYATQFVAISPNPSWCAPEWQTDPWNHMPQLVDVNNFGKQFKAVHFRQACDPIVPALGCAKPGDPCTPSHVSDRLIQNTNLDFPDDPTDITITEDITLYVVLKHLAFNPSGAPMLGFWNSIVSKRGPAFSPWEFGMKPASTNPNVYNNAWSAYAGSEVVSGIVAQQVWSIVEISHPTSGLVTFREFYQGVGWLTSTVYHGRADACNDGTPCMLSGMAQGIAATPENPLGNGSGHRYFGDMAEVMLFARSVGDTERAQIEAYFMDKYFPRSCGDYGTTTLSGDLNGDCKVDFKDVGVFAGTWLKCTDPANALCNSYWP